MITSVRIEETTAGERRSWRVQSRKLAVSVPLQRQRLLEGSFVYALIYIGMMVFESRPCFFM